MNFVRLLCLLLLVSISNFSGAVKKGELLVWINNDKGYNGVREVGEKFEAATGTPVIVETPDSLTTQFDRLAPTGKGPDIVIWAHDRFGVWINEGLLREVEPSDKMRDSVAPFTWQAVTVGNQIFGYPIAIEAVSLIYNRSLVDTPPQTLKDVVALDRKLQKDGVKALEWDYNNTYFTWPIIASTGAYSFGKSEGLYSLIDIGFDNKNAASAVSEIANMIKSGVLAGDANYGSMMTKFKAGQVASIINGPWAWEEIRQAGIDFGLGHVPAAGKNDRGRPFVGVLAAAISTNSREVELAEQFLEDYLLTYDGLKLVNADKPLGAVANKKLLAELSSDQKIAHTFDAAEGGELMPDIPEMKRFWGQFSTRLPQMLQGKLNTGKTLTQIADRLKKMDKVKGFRRRHYPSGVEE